MNYLLPTAGVACGLATVCGFRFLNDIKKYRPLTPLDQKVQTLINTQDLYFTLPYFTTQTVEGKQIRCGRVSFSRDISFKVPLGQDITVEVVWVKGQPVIKCRDLNSYVLKDWDDKTKNMLKEYCVETLNQMHSLSFLSFALGFRPTSEEIMRKSALEVFDKHRQKQPGRLYDEVLTNERLKMKRTAEEIPGYRELVEKVRNQIDNEREENIESVTW